MPSIGAHVDWGIHPLTSGHWRVTVHGQPRGSRHTIEEAQALHAEEMIGDWEKEMDTAQRRVKITQDLGKWKGAWKGKKLMYPRLVAYVRQLSLMPGMQILQARLHELGEDTLLQLNDGGAPLPASQPLGLVADETSPYFATASESVLEPMSDHGEEEDEVATLVGSRVVDLVTPDDSASRPGSPSLRDNNAFRILEVGRPGASKPSISMEPEETIVEQVKQAAGFKFVNPLFSPNREQQLGASCGHNIRLVSWCKQRHGHEGSGGVGTRSIAEWYKRNMDQVPTHLQGREFGGKPGNIQICHIISDALGGTNWVYNYVLATKEVNDYFKEKYTAEWERYVGAEPAEYARLFQKWYVKKAAAYMAFGAFDAFSDKFLAKGRM